MTNFLQDHYNRAMDAGLSHVEYVIVNDLSENVAEQLRAEYAKQREKRKKKP